MADNGRNMERLAESSLLKLMARLFAAIGVPIAAAFFIWAVGELAAVRLELTRVHTALLVGIEPRVKDLESEVAVIRQQMEIRTANRFDKNDATALQLQFQREMDRLQKELEALRRIQKQ